MLHVPHSPQSPWIAAWGLLLSALLALGVPGKHLHMAEASITNNLQRVLTGGKANSRLLLHDAPPLNNLNLPSASQFLISTGACLHPSVSYPGDYATGTLCGEFTASRDGRRQEPALSCQEREHLSSQPAAAAGVKQG